MIKKLFLIIITVTTISCGQSGWWWSDGIYVAPRTLNAEGDSFKINLTVPDFVSGDTLKLYYNNNLIETFFEDTTTVLGLADNTQYCYVLKRQTFQGLSSGTQACATTIDTIIVGALSTPVLLATDSTGNKIKLSVTGTANADSIYYYYRMADSMYNPVWFHQWTKIVRPVSDSIYYFTNVPNGWALRFYAELKNTTSILTLCFSGNGMKVQKELTSTPAPLTMIVLCAPSKSQTIPIVP